MNGRIVGLDEFRLALALVVALFHAQVLAGEQPILPWLLSPFFAVSAFFILSGFLIFRTLDRPQKLTSYLTSRFLRIYPAYAVVVLVSAAVFAPQTNASSIRYVFANLALVNFIAPGMAGVFEGNPESAINGSLWTIKIEVAFYLLAPLIAWVGHRCGAVKVLAVSAIASALWLATFVWLGEARSAYQMPGQVVFFCIGGLIHHATRTRIMPRATGSQNPDLSYGLYLCHYPIIQALVASDVHHTSYYLPAAFALSLAGAALIWFLVERPVQIWQAELRARRQREVATLA